MFYVVAEFPPNIDSQDLYEEVKYYHLNVCDIIMAVYLHGLVSVNDIGKVMVICAKYNMIDINLYDAAE